MRTGLVTRPSDLAAFGRWQAAGGRGLAMPTPLFEKGWGVAADQHPNPFTLGCCKVERAVLVPGGTPRHQHGRALALLVIPTPSTLTILF